MAPATHRIGARSAILMRVSEQLPKDHRNPAAIYNEKRRILFSQIHKDDNTNTALQWLERYKEVLGPKGHSGLLAEIRFYEVYRKDYALTVAGDMGDATDFDQAVFGQGFDGDRFAGRWILREISPINGIYGGEITHIR